MVLALCLSGVEVVWTEWSLKRVKEAKMVLPPIHNRCRGFSTELVRICTKFLTLIMDRRDYVNNLHVGNLVPHCQLRDGKTDLWGVASWLPYLCNGWTEWSDEKPKCFGREKFKRWLTESNFVSWVDEVDGPHQSSDSWAKTWLWSDTS